MGYTTEFEGSFSLDKPLTPQQIAEFKLFTTKSHSTRDGYPSFYCQWVPSKDGTEIVWNGGEKFYEYIPWLKYIITKFIEPWGYKLNGEVEWQGEEPGDFGKILVQDNNVLTKKGKRVYE